jgi:Ca-activated chloride channel homolog
MVAARLTRRFTLSFACAVLAAGLTTSFARQSSGPSHPPDSNLKTIYVTVTDAQDRLVAGLKPEDFTVYDGGRPARVASVSVENEPASINLLLDASGSIGLGGTGGKEAAGLVRNALLRFLRGCHAASEFSLTVFNNKQHLLLEKTSDPAALLAALDRYGSTEPRGLTALYDTLYFAVARAGSGRHTKRAILVISDGQDTASRYKFDQLERAVTESDAIVYAVALPGAHRDDAHLTQAGRYNLLRLTELSGGKFFYVGDERRLHMVMERVAEELRSHYALLVEPVPAKKKDGWHELRVKVSEGRDAAGRRHKFEARTRRGFYATRSAASPEARGQGR